MKYLVVSDIHGALSGAQSVCDAYAYHNVDFVLCLGDVLYHGPRNDLPKDYAPKEVIPLMNSIAHQITGVRGNCDAEVDQMVLNFPLTADYQVFKLGTHRVFMTHGHVYGLDKLPPLEPGDIFLSGHTHLPTTTETDGIYYLNPGSISLPKENHQPTYAILEDDSFTIYTRDHEIYMTISF